MLEAFFFFFKEKHLFLSVKVNYIKPNKEDYKGDTDETNMLETLTCPQPISY